MRNITTSRMPSSHQTLDAALRAIAHCCLVGSLVLLLGGCTSVAIDLEQPRTLQPPEITQEFGVIPPAVFQFRDVNRQGYPEYVFEIDGSLMVLIPGDELNPPFLIDKFEITNSQYRHFCSAVGRQRPKHPTNPAWQHYYFYPKTTHPIDHVAWFDAMEYARWSGKSLPTIQEWRRASTAGGDPAWAGAPEGLAVANLMDVGHRSPDRIGSYPADVSYCGVHDMLGNIDEWVADAGYAQNRRVMGGFWGSSREVALQQMETGTSDDAHEPRHGFRTIYRLTRRDSGASAGN